MFPNITKFPWRNIDILIICVLRLIDSLTGIVSLGFHVSNFDMIYLMWRSQKMVSSLKEKQND
jgi:hypothetical protein